MTSRKVVGKSGVVSASRIDRRSDEAEEEERGEAQDSNPASPNEPEASFTFEDEAATQDLCFRTFDKDADARLNLAEFRGLCRALFRVEGGEESALDSETLKTIFDVFDTNQDGAIDEKEFDACWQEWIRRVVRPVTALVVVDVQNDFISGSLALKDCRPGQDGEQFIGHINRLLDEVRFDLVVYTLDWHPNDHVSFFENVRSRPLHESCKLKYEDVKMFDVVVFDVHGDGRKTEQKLWPKHCVQNSWGAELHKDLKVVEDAVVVRKGTNPDVDSYSSFWDNSRTSQTNLKQELIRRGVTDVFLCGIAFDICVAATALDSLGSGFRTIVVEDAARSVCDCDAASVKERIGRENGIVVTSSRVQKMASGRERPYVLGLQLALELGKTLKKVPQ